MGYRTLLFAPASDRRKVEKALLSEADGVILDLEDAVAPSEKEQARANIVEILAEKPGKSVVVRVNGLNTPWSLKDLLAVIPLQPEGLMIPKVESALDVAKVNWLIDQLLGKESELGLYPMIETALGVEEAVGIARSDRRIQQLVFGALDYAADLALTYSADPWPLAYARSRIVGASVAAGVEGPLDAVFPGIKDEEGLRQDTWEGKKLGFKGKLLIHPAQITPVNEIFSPTEAELEDARQIMEVYENALAEGKGAIQWKGKMLDEPVLKWAKRLLGAGRPNE